MAPKSGNDPKGKKPQIVSSSTKKRTSSIPEASSSESDVKTLLTQILGSVGELHQKTDLISTRLVLLEQIVREQKKKEIIFIKQWVDKEEDEKENEENDEEDAEETKGNTKEGDEEEEEGETEAAKEISSGTKSTIPASSKGHRYGLRSRFGTKFSNTSDNPLVLTPSPPSSPSP